MPFALRSQNNHERGGQRDGRDEADESSGERGCLGFHFAVLAC